ncbi:uncharacterized protein BDW43DRAFT_248646 [Aspergillus alliaceus]|uniref:uncharacterized protein n=1 Tax=Petromyces alliaceus TaxID=209559 RepID=UPI0012A43DAB|nr:uncharacterized protein BDW43DRAFT_248646 [Aspergillus alliaceus]KAB8236129.1 hypothetical protein BDW43DRAFT_248646 [Aspergillus alliaceus]
MARGSAPGTETITSPHSPIHLLTVLNSPRTSSRSMPSTSRAQNKSSSLTSGRKTSSTMRRTSAQAEIPLPITYTPTTHRISKAKKGKRVHACEYPGCNKVFTRAEHRRRHELNHNPEALFRCTHVGCKKAFHRPDLLARHVERHELENQMNNAQWGRQSHLPMVSESPYLPKGAPVDPNAGHFLAATHPATSMSIGSIVAPHIHPDLANDTGLMWMGMDMSSGHQTPIYPHQIHESVEDNQFYSSPENCPSPSSDGATLSIPSHPRSSVASTPTAIAEPYPENIVDADLTSSPMPVHESLRCWDQSEGPLATPSYAPVSLNESLAQSVSQSQPVTGNMTLTGEQPFHCQYPSPTWSATHHFGYDDHPLPTGTQFPPPMPWKSFTI